MTSSKFRFNVLLLATLISSTARGDVSKDCQPPSLASSDLHISSRSDRNGVFLSTYIDSKPASPYATEFDQRKVVIAYSANDSSLIAMAGIPIQGEDARGYRTQLSPLPESDQAIRRIPELKVQNHLGWRIYIERVEYGAQGGGIGYAVDCATALKAIAQKKMTAVSECFALEHRQRFMETLTLVRYQ